MPSRRPIIRFPSSQNAARKTQVPQFHGSIFGFLLLGKRRLLTGFQPYGLDEENMTETKTRQ